jgi:2-polyprenyl-6-methoxyphenol hydroxylase-like FAD-dependent oxidoreductase
MLFHHMVFGFAEGSLMLSVPMPAPSDDTPGARACHYVWFQPADEAALAGLCTDATGHRHGRSIPPPLIRPEIVADLKTRAAALLPPQLAHMVTRTAQPILQPIFDLAAPAIVFGRVALLGDAAFAARPHVATGVMKAALDAATLADALRASGNDVAAALARYQQERVRFGDWLVARGRHIGGEIEAHFAARGEPSGERIATIMREYGAAGIVADEPITAR